MRVNYLPRECLFPSGNAAERGSEERAIERKTGRERVYNLEGSDEGAGHYCFQENKLLEGKREHKLCSVPNR